MQVAHEILHKRFCKAEPGTTVALTVVAFATRLLWQRSPVNDLPLLNHRA